MHHSLGVYFPAGVEFGEHVCCAQGHSCDTVLMELRLEACGKWWEIHA